MTGRRELAARGRGIIDGGDAVIVDLWGRPVRFPEERWRHIIGKRPEMAGMREVIPGTLQDPEAVRISPQLVKERPGQILLYHRWHFGTAIGDKLICVAALFFDDGDAFVLSAFPTDNFKAGVEIWNKRTW